MSQSAICALWILALASSAFAQTKTTVADTLYSPSGTALSGAITITNNATFSAADGTVVPKGAVATVTVTNGAFSVALVPNEGSTPSGSSYNAVYKLGQTYLSETWVVPSSASSVDLSAVRTSPTPSPSVVFAASQMPALTGDVNSSAGSAATRVVQLHFGTTALTLSPAPGDGQCLARSGSTITGTDCGSAGGSMIYPGAGVPSSTGSAWGTSYGVGSGPHDLVQLNASGQLPAVSAANLTNFPTLNQNTTGNAATATALAATPTQCTPTQFMTGIAANGNANCDTPAGGGSALDLSNLTNPTAIALPTLMFTGEAGVTAGSAGGNHNITLTPGGSGLSLLDNLADRGGQVWNVKAFGAVGNGASDDTAAIQAAIDAAAVAGGTVYFPQGVYLVAGALTIPNAGGANPRQTPLRLTGVGSDMQTTGTYPAGAYGSVLNLTYSGGTAKFDTTGIGKLEIDHLTLEDTAGDSVPFVVTTNTTLRIHHCTFLGSKTGTAADQDAIVLGTATVNFQGYGTVIQDNFFDYIRRAVYLLRGANAVQIVDNSIWTHAGTNLPAGAAIELDGNGDQAVGNYISGNLFEMAGYVYGIKFTRAGGNTALGNTFFDPSGQALGVFNVDADSPANLLSCSLTSGTECVTGTPPGSTTELNSGSSGRNLLANNLFVNAPAGVAFNGAQSAIWAGAGNGLTLQLYGDNSGVDPKQFDIAGLTDPNQEIKIGYNTTGNYGSIEAIHTGVALVPLNLQPQGGNVGIATTNPQAQLDVAGDVRADNYSFHNGINWTSGAGAPSGAPTNGSLYSRTDGGSGTSVYAYEGGAWLPLGSSEGGGMVYPGVGIAISTGSAWGTSLAAPSGAIVGTTDTQTLTNKTVDGVSPTTMSYLDATSSIQTQLNGKLANVVEDTTPQLGGNLDLNSHTIAGFTASRALETNGSGNLQVSAVTSTELNYLDGVTSSIQTQLNGKLSVTPANVTTTVGTSAVSANACTSTSQVTMTGLVSTMALTFTPNADVSGVTGWGANGGLVIVAWPASNTVNYKVCNQTGNSITPSSSVTFNVSAK